MSSWVKVSRKLLTSAIASKPEYLAVWMHLILSASYKPGEVLVGHQVVKLNAGQLVFGRIKFAQQIGVSEHTLRMALKSLETLQQITIKSESKFSVITITNWSKYQTDSPADHQQATSKPPASHHNKEVLEIQEEEQKQMSPGSPDDGDERPQKKQTIPYQEILNRYHRHLPMLPRVVIFEEPRKKVIRGRWNAHPKCQTLDFWDDFFQHIGKSDFLMGRTKDPWTGCCFDWIFKPANFNKIVEGNYNREQS